MAKFATDAIGAMLLSSLVQVTESISGSVVPLAMFDHFPGRSGHYLVTNYNFLGSCALSGPLKTKNGLFS